jgi:hypothetical protein
MKNIDKKLYKFALFGLSGSGKTCILTAMGMDRRPAIEGATLIIQPADSSDPEDTKIGDRNLATYKDSLENGNLPEPTPNSLDDVPRYRYAYTDTELGKAYFEIHDYSGELLNPRLLANGSDMISRIRSKMRDLDGIIVLAVAPKKGETKSEIPSEINHIIQAFSALQATQTSERKTPIALVLTKWDRQSDIPQNSENAETATLDQFFNKYESYRNIVDALQNSIGKEHFRSFPISALGHCNDEDFPVTVNPLLSYGLTYPFRFLIQQINEMDGQRLETLAVNLPKGYLPLVLPTGKFVNEKLKFARFTNFFKPIDESLQLSTKLINRLPESFTSKIVTAKKFRRQTILNIASRSISLFCVCYILWFVFVATLNSRMLRSAELAIKNVANETVLLRCEKKLTAYCKGSYFPFTPPHLSKNKAKAMLDEIKGIYEELDFNVWKIADLKEGDKKREAGRIYLTKYPVGKYTDDIQKWTAENDEKEIENGNQVPLNSLSQLLEIAKRSNSITDFQKVIDDGNKEPFFGYPNYVTKEQEKQKATILAEANNKLAELQWEEFARRVKETFNGGNIVTALQMLSGISNKTEKWQILCHEILVNVETNVYIKIPTSGNRAIQEITQIRNAVSQLGSVGAEGTTSIVQNLDRKIADIKWNNFEQQVRETPAIEALSLLAKSDRRDNKWQDLCKNILDKTERQVTENIRTQGSNYSGAISSIEQAIVSVTELSNSGANSADMVLQKFNGKITEIKERWDRSLYTAVQTNRNITACENYLNLAPLKTMRNAVQRYKQYLTKLENILTIECSDEKGNNQQTVSGRLGDIVTIKINETVDSNNHWFSPVKIHIVGEKKVTLSDLRQGVSVDASGSGTNPNALVKISTYTASYTRKIVGTGFPEEPYLP